jgi:hypothetical protein
MFEKEPTSIDKPWGNVEYGHAYFAGMNEAFQYFAENNYLREDTVIAIHLEHFLESEKVWSDNKREDDLNYVFDKGGRILTLKNTEGVHLTLE